MHFFFTTGTWYFNVVLDIYILSLCILIFKCRLTAYVYSKIIFYYLSIYSIFVFSKYYLTPRLTLFHNLVIGQNLFYADFCFCFFIFIFSSNSCTIIASYLSVLLFVYIMLASATFNCIVKNYFCQEKVFILLQINMLSAL